MAEWTKPWTTANLRGHSGDCMLLMLNQRLQIKINAEEQESYEIRRLEDNLVCLHA